MIIFITFNPAIDVSIVVDQLHGRDLVAEQVSYRLAGKGINAAEVLATAGIACRSIVFAGQTPVILARQSKHEIVEHADMMRQNFSIYEKGSLLAHIRSPFRTSFSQLARLFAVLEATVSRDDIVVVAGSLPELTDDSDYETFVERFSLIKGRLVIDTASLPLRQLQRLAPHTIKINAREFRALAGLSEQESLSTLHLASVSQSVNSSIIVTQGAGDVLSVDGDGRCTVHSIMPDLVNSRPSAIGSGDAFLAGYLAALGTGAQFKDCVRSGMVYGVARQKVTDLDDMDLTTSAIGSLLGGIIEEVSHAQI